MLGSGYPLIYFNISKLLSPTMYVWNLHYSVYFQLLIQMFSTMYYLHIKLYIRYIISNYRWELNQKIWEYCHAFQYFTVSIHEASSPSWFDYWFPKTCSHLHIFIFLILLVWYLFCLQHLFLSEHFLLILCNTSTLWIFDTHIVYICDFMFSK